mmetsp:Transcript_110149/g.311433  ORF Transcript_110149/g.311433 Transcript_110149/m.311433 type:complete len:386 (+) Transcript_110149:179-1336(+)
MWRPTTSAASATTEGKWPTPAVSSNSPRPGIASGRSMPSVQRVAFSEDAEMAIDVDTNTGPCRGFTGTEVSRASTVNLEPPSRLAEKLSLVGPSRPPLCTVGTSNGKTISWGPAFSPAPMTFLASPAGPRKTPNAWKSPCLSATDELPPGSRASMLTPPSGKPAWAVPVTVTPHSKRSPGRTTRGTEGTRDTARREITEVVACPNLCFLAPSTTYTLTSNVAMLSGSTIGTVAIPSSPTMTDAAKRGVVVNLDRVYIAFPRGPPPSPLAAPRLFLRAEGVVAGAGVVGGGAALAFAGAASASAYRAMGNPLLLVIIGIAIGIASSSMSPPPPLRAVTTSISLPSWRGCQIAAGGGCVSQSNFSAKYVSSGCSTGCCAWGLGLSAQ